MVWDTTTRPIKNPKTAAVRIAPPAPVFIVQYVRDFRANSARVRTSTSGNRCLRFCCTSDVEYPLSTRKRTNIASSGPAPIYRLAFRSEEHTSELQSRENLVYRL